MYPLGGSADRLSLVDSGTGGRLPGAMLPYCGRILLEGLIRDLQLYGKQCITPVAIMTISAVSAEDGQWLVRKPFVPVCKPSGHGIIWKLAYYKSIFEWFYDHGRKCVTVQQVRCDPLGIDRDHSLHHGKKLGFASYKRNIGATEGINVLIEKKNLDREWAYGLSCIEYTEFDEFGITSGRSSANCLQAEFPANTNILYVDLPSAELVGLARSERTYLE
ncbi:hypothetical protein GQ457_09G030530 [Hibiscus cannabinus]